MTRRAVAFLGAAALLLAACSGENPDRVTSLPDENSVFADDEAPAPTPTPSASPEEVSDLMPNGSFGDLMAPDPAPTTRRTGTPEDLLAGTAATSTERYSRYDCRRGSGFSVTFDGEGGATLTLDEGAVVQLDERTVAAGTLYRGEGFELRGRGRTATLIDPDGNVRDCTAG